MSPAEARAVLRGRLEWHAVTWIDMELLGASGRRRRRYQEQQERERREQDQRARDLALIAALPDSDLEWLLSVGWNPERAQ